MIRRFLLKKRWLAAAAVVLSASIFLVSRVDLRGGYEGIILLGGGGLFSFRITDDMYHGEESTLLFSLPLQFHNSVFSVPKSYANTDTTLTHKWNEMTGRGFVASNYPNGTKLVTSFGRFIEPSGIAPSGLFLGGNLPFAVNIGSRTAPNVTGMSFYDGARWNHIWGSAKEAVLIYDALPVHYSPSSMRYLGSKVLKATDKELVIMSRHEINLPDSTLHMQRYAFFKAGDIHFFLVNRISNMGQGKISYSYTYGDEPAVGNSGPARGDVGWLNDRLVHEEQAIDTRRYSHAGMFDYGNPLINESHNFTWMANFIEWFGERPDAAFFSNQPGYFDHRKLPLASDTRSIGLQWSPQILAPGESRTYIMAIGMAGRDAMSGFPVKPRVDFPQELYREHVR